MQIDVPTMVIVAAIANMAMAASLSVVLRGQHAALNGSLPVWTQGIALQSIGWFLLAFRGQWPDAVALVASNTLLGWGLAECCDALRRFDQQPRRHRLPYLLSGMILLVSVLFAYPWPDRFLRLVINSSLLAIIFATASGLAWRARSSPLPGARSHRLVALVFGLATVVLVTRVISALAAGREQLPSIKDVDLLQALFYLSAALGPAIATLGFALMCNERLGAELTRIANEDALTGVHNRRSLELIAQTILTDVKRRVRTLSMVLLDADHFKKINDRHGHAAGDAALRKLASVLVSETGQRGVVGRFGGEEFLILLPDMPLADAMTLANCICLRIHQNPLEIEAQAVRWSISAGVAEYGEHDGGFDALVRRADQALYRAKRDGRNRIEAATVG